MAIPVNSVPKAVALFAVAASVVLSGCAQRSGSDGYASEVETPGSGRYDKIKLNAGVIISDGSIEATIPSRISEGTTISVSYLRDGVRVVDDLDIDHISTKEISKGTLCRLHSAPERTVGDTVYVRPCKVLR